MSPRHAPSSFGSSSRLIRHGLAVFALSALATCNDLAEAPGLGAIKPVHKKLGPAPATEVATWRRGVSATAPEGRFLQAVAFDETRQVVVMFGGENRSVNFGAATPTQDLWEWSQATGQWSLRAATGTVPDARAGAAMAFDSARNKMVLFGGRAASGYNYEDLWEWDPTTGAWSEKSNAGSHPSARAQHGMVYEKASGKILLFGGGRSTAPSSDGTSVSASLGDTWELDPTTGTWAQLAPTGAPSVRHDFGLVWDSTRNKAVLFGGMQIDIPGATGVPKQDTWEWDPTGHTWSERTVTGSKPSQRFGHAMTFDATRGKVVLFGGWDMTTSGSRNDLWDWDAGTGVWTQRLAGTEAGLPGPRSYTSMIFDTARSRCALVAGQVNLSDSSSGTFGLVGTNEVWELDPAAATFTNRSTAYAGPTARAYHAMAYNPTTGKVYVFGGVDPMLKSTALSDLWEWDGTQWTKVLTDQSPPERIDGAIAYDPARQSLIAFGGNSWTTGTYSGDTWEWSSTTRQWSQLTTHGAPEPRWGHAMVTDAARKKILLFGGSSLDSSGGGDVWEWDGATLTWTNRTPVASSRVPAARVYPAMTFDDARQKLVLYDGSRSPSVDGESTSAFWDWDPVTAGWSLRDPGDTLPDASNLVAMYDPSRRRHVFVTDAGSSGNRQTWELDARSAAWYVRSLPNTPGNRFRSAGAFDVGRNAGVLFGGTLNEAPGGTANDTWEYRVTNLANGEGCSAAAACASGNCVEGVCCETAGCSGACQSCNVLGSEGTCVLAAAGTEVSGSCADGQACDGTGACKSKNGQACTSATACASGFCADGVCCDVACDGKCTACNLQGRVGTCAAYAAGTDPAGECGQGTAPCKSTCDGVGDCTFPTTGVSCGACLTCDGAGTCGYPDPACGTGGVPGKGAAGGTVPGKGGTGGSVTAVGGAGGPSTTAGGGGGAVGGSSGSSTGKGGAGGAVAATGGAGGQTTSSTGAGGPGARTSLDAGGTIARGGAGGAGGAGGTLGGTGGKSGVDAGVRDGAAEGDAALVARLNRGGCSCTVGSREEASRNLGPWLALLGVGLVARRARRRAFRQGSSKGIREPDRPAQVR
jgi:MYXO-CTERM domain-containing protein